MEKKIKFQPQHRTCSHPGLISPLEGPGPGKSEDWESVTQRSYVPPKYDTRSTVGARTRLMEKFFWQELTEEAYDDWVAPNPVEEYVSEYEGEYNICDFKPSIDNIPKDSDLHKKYPLYSSSALSIYKEGHHSGSTKVINPSHPFRKNGQFSKPLADILDEPPTGFQ